ncbi:MAG: patatin-like phospholipase family protein [Deltaproteobacteria bacterium]|nr:patatin-like phospholipase family protein [Deltaproteobacteria bacterium]
MDRLPGADQNALVLSAGGARGAYQAGVLRGVVEIGKLSGQRCPFSIFAGTSAGALNCAALTAFADDFAGAVTKLVELWSSVTTSQIFRVDLRSYGAIGLRWVRDLSLGGLMRANRVQSLLDTSPLRALIQTELPFARIGEMIDAGQVKALAVSATNMHTANGVTFVQAGPSLKLWQRPLWVSERATIGADHVLASGAIPIFFPAVRIGERYFSDGGIRNTAPLRPAIQLGARRILAVGVRREKGAAEEARHRAAGPPSIGQVAGVLVNTVLLDAIEIDVERIERVNRFIAASPTDAPAAAFSPIDAVWISPSVDLGELAASHVHRIPRTVRHLLHGLGSEESTSALASYLMFVPDYCRALIALGQADAWRQRDRIEALLVDATPAEQVR